jgi:uncharacterized repeat protein (TIGR01451 family)
VGQDVTFTLTIANHGPDVATGVTVTDTLPAGVTFVSADPAPSAENGRTLTFNLNTLANAARATATIVVTPTTAGTITNVAQVGAHESDPDPTNNTSSLPVTVQALPPNPSADLVVTQVITPSPAAVGQDLTITLTVVNHGPDTATGVIVSDTLPAGVDFVSATPSQGSAARYQGVVTVALGTLADDARATVTLVVIPTEAGSFRNAAGVESATANPNPADGSTSQPISVESPTNPPTVTPRKVTPLRVESLAILTDRHRRTRLVLTFNEPLDSTEAQNPANYLLFPLRRHRGVLIRKRHGIVIGSSLYDAGGPSVTLSPAKRRLNRHAFYELVVSGTDPGGLTDLQGQFLDGDGDGQAGTNYVTVFKGKVPVVLGPGSRLVGPSDPAVPYARSWTQPGPGAPHSGGG